MSILPELYSLKHLSEMVDVEMDVLLMNAVAMGIKPVKKVNMVYVQRDDVRALLRETGKGIIRAYYDLSRSVLPHLDTLWGKALVELYMEDSACPASLSPTQGELLRSLILNIKPQKCLEIGCFIGASTLWICSALEECGADGVLHSVDLYGDKLPFGRYKYLFHPDALSSIRQRLEVASLGHRNIQHEGNSRVVGSEYAARIGEKLDFLFIDGDHTKEGCFADFLLYEPHLLPGGYLVFHDIFPEKCGWDGPRFVIDQYIMTQPHKYQVIELNTTPLDYGLAIIKKLVE